LFRAIGDQYWIALKAEITRTGDVSAPAPPLIQ
jgi:hypothetical protein